MGKFSRLGNDLYSGQRSIDFVGRRWLWYAISGLIILAAVLGLSFKGLDMGIEFVGGAEYKVQLPAGDATQDLADQVRNEVAATGLDAAQQPVVTTSGRGDTNSIIVQVKPVTSDESNQIAGVITDVTGTTKGDIQTTEIGPSWAGRSRSGPRSASRSSSCSSSCSSGRTSASGRCRSPASSR